VLLTIFKRSIILFALGFLMYWFPFTGDLQDTRIFATYCTRIFICSFDCTFYA
jgi:predicted acyltransferase